MDVVEVLEKAKERLRGHWCQGTYAMRDDGSQCPTLTPGCRVRAHGAIMSLYLPGERPAKVGAVELLNEATKQISGGQYTHAPSYNDTEGRTEEEVLALFDKAIELAKAEEVNAK